MIYHNFQDVKISAFAMGLMRLPVIDGKDEHIDEAVALDMVKYAYDHGVNYYDTAWGYHGGNSETFIGKALSSYPRESFFLASKFPGYDSSNWPKVEEIFEEQLKKCQVEYFDFYLFHNVCEMNIDAYLDDKQYKIYSYLKAQKENGRIKHLGVSVHGSYEVLERFLEAYGKDIEFCQIQLNYIDYTFQEAKAKMELLAKWGIDVWVMEPMRGGMLAKATKEEEARLKALRPDESVAAWALRWLQAQSQVVTVLNGCSSLEQLQENIAIFSEEKPLDAEELAVLEDIVQARLQGKITPCTACRYCVSHCPQGIDIPHMMELYNEHNFTGGGFIAPMALDAVDKDKRPDACVACGACAEVCPQQIKIPETLAAFAEMLK